MKIRYRLKLCSSDNELITWMFVSLMVSFSPALPFPHLSARHICHSCIQALLMHAWRFPAPMHCDMNIIYVISLLPRIHHQIRADHTQVGDGIIKGKVSQKGTSLIRYQLLPLINYQTLMLPFFVQVITGSESDQVLHVYLYFTLSTGVRKKC